MDFEAFEKQALNSLSFYGVVQRFTTILFELQLMQTHRLRVRFLGDTRHKDVTRKLTTGRQRCSLLGDLIAGRRIGVEIVLTIEHGDGM